MTTPVSFLYLPSSCLLSMRFMELCGLLLFVRLGYPGLFLSIYEIGVCERSLSFKHGESVVF